MPQCPLTCGSSFHICPGFVRVTPREHTRPGVFQRREDRNLRQQPAQELPEYQLYQRARTSCQLLSEYPSHTGGGGVFTTPPVSSAPTRSAISRGVARGDVPPSGAGLGRLGIGEDTLPLASHMNPRRVRFTCLRDTAASPRPSGSGVSGTTRLRAEGVSRTEESRTEETRNVEGKPILAQPSPAQPTPHRLSPRGGAGKAGWGRPGARSRDAVRTGGCGLGRIPKSLVPRLLEAQLSRSGALKRTQHAAANANRYSLAEHPAPPLPPPAQRASFLTAAAPPRPSPQDEPLAEVHLHNTDWNKYDDRLMKAVERGEVDKVAAVLSKKGVVPTKLDVEGRSAFHLAAARGHLDCLNLILGHNVELKPQERDTELAAAPHC
ncbi:hypothetical protein COCON_G00216000 [Conger conger]|uniref:Uncharacterized protein n=1 Tax=Conger conger TaxID=82655 RepID=A0A9Q1HPD7_CONCO|nr:hypothetical protein COCON_G00216000 [Conger conger]